MNTPETHKIGLYGVFKEKRYWGCPIYEKSAHTHPHTSYTLPSSIFGSLMLHLLLRLHIAPSTTPLLPLHTQSYISPHFVSPFSLQFRTSTHLHILTHSRIHISNPTLLLHVTPITPNIMYS